MAAALEARLTEGRREGGHRALAYALLASVALHCTLLAALRAPATRAQPNAADLAPLIATLLPLRPTAEPTRAMPAPRLEPVARPRAAFGPRRGSAPAPAPSHAAPRAMIARTRPGPEIRTAEMPVALRADAAPETAAAALLPATHADEAALGARPMRRGGTSADRAAALAQYRLALIAEARRYRDYPRLALDNDWRGKVDVRVAVAANGALASLSVGRGSGHEVLDRQALEMIRKAKPLAPIPAALRGRAFTLDIPVIFELREPSA